jgi:sec-independent protein translocase protein TatC
VIVGAFVIGMLLTPPDIISQVLLAVPMWILFEVGLIASAIMFKDRNMDSADDDEALDDEDLAASNDSKSDDFEKSKD